LGGRQGESSGSAKQLRKGVGESGRRLAASKGGMREGKEGEKRKEPQRARRMLAFAPFPPNRPLCQARPSSECSDEPNLGHPKRAHHAAYASIQPTPPTPPSRPHHGAGREEERRGTRRGAGSDGLRTVHTRVLDSAQRNQEGGKKGGSGGKEHASVGRSVLRW
jgi:hypothetical protein